MSEISPLASVDPNARIGAGCVIHPFVVVAPGVTLGAGVEVFPGAMLGKEPKGVGATARPISFERSVLIGDGCSIGPNSVVYYGVTIGAGTLIGDGASVREGGRIGSRCLISRHVTLNYNCRIGDGTKVMDLTHLTGEMTIGNGVFISAGVMTVNDNAMGSDGFGGHIVGPTIEDRASIGAGAVLFPGIRIGSGAIVGAGAVVTKDVAPHSRVMGIPARPS